MKKALLALLLLTACASVDDDPPPPQRTPGAGRRMPARVAVGGTELLPPANWWRDPQISANVKLSEAQFTSLDEIGRAHSADLDALRTDARDAERDLRLLLIAEQPTANDLLAAGTRLRTVRDHIMEQEVRMLADERALLSREQWTALQDALRDERQSDFGGRRGGMGGGRGGRRGGGGRRPGM